MSLLEKNLPLPIDEENPFKDDCLDRKTVILNLTTLIRSLTQPFVISIEAPWGSGKTTFVQMWQQYLINDDQPCLYFNAWENDFAVDPLIAFLGEMNKLLDQEKNRGKNPDIQESWKKVKELGGHLIKHGLPPAIRILSHGIISEDMISKLPQILVDSKDEIGTFLADISKDSIQAFIDEKNSVQAFKNELETFSQLVVDEGKQSPIVIFIDELDRCRPTYAIELLERVKHLFNIPGVVFILSLDRQQLENSVSATYGNNIDSNGYLARFIDYRFKLPEASDDGFINYLIKKFSIDEVLSNRKYVYSNDENPLILRFTRDYFQIYMLSLRLQEQYFTELNLVLRLFPKNYALFPHILSLLIILKIHKKDIYERFLQKSISPEEVLKSMPTSKITDEFINSYDGGFLEGLLYKYLTPQEIQQQRKQKYIEYRDTGISLGEITVTKEHIRGFIRLMESTGSNSTSNEIINIIFNKLSLIEEIRSG